MLPVEIFSNQSLSACKNALTLEERKLEGLSAVQRRHPLTDDMLTCSVSPLGSWWTTWAMGLNANNYGTYSARVFGA
eukprot:gene36347-44840_t